MVLFLITCGAAASSALLLLGPATLVINGLEARCDQRDMSRALGAAIQAGIDPAILPRPGVIPWVPFPIRVEWPLKGQDYTVLMSQSEILFLTRLSREGRREEAEDLMILITSPLEQGRRARELNMAA